MSGETLDALEQRFALEARVGSGAFGEVFRGRDARTGQLVAIKRPHAHHHDAVAVERFLREARLLARVASPHVVGYVAHGLDAGGRPWLALDWLAGEDLAHRQARAPLGTADALSVVRQAALGLAALHAAGIVHRDVKPANFVLLAPDDARAAPPQVKLIDLGIARVLAGAALTLDGARIGTPAYMSPEQARGDEGIGARSDLFSLGVVLYELLARRRPFRGEDPYALLAKIVLQEPPPLGSIAPALPPELGAIVARALAKDPAARFASAGEFALALDAAAARLAAEPAGPAAQVPADHDPREPAGASLPGGDDAAATTVGDAVAASDDAALATVLGSSAIAALAEQRVVTAVFVEFAAGPALARAAEVFAAVVAAHGGTTHRTLGRRAVAVFGLARSSGNEVVRAARAALEAQRALPSLRLSIATCRVTTSSAAALSGDAIDRGMAQMDSAAAGEPARGSSRPPAAGGAARVALDPVSARLLAPHFAVDGLDTETPMLRPERAGEGAGPRLFGRRTPTLGREREIASLAALVDEAVDAPAARAALVTGPLGVGKSRVRYELIERVRAAHADAEVLLGRGDSVGAGSPFGMLAGALRRAAGVLDGAPRATRRARLWEYVARDVTGRDALPRVAAFLGELAGVPFVDERAARRADADADADADPDAPAAPPLDGAPAVALPDAVRDAVLAARRDPMLVGDAMRAAWEDWAAAVCAARPLVVVLDDLHWGDLPTVRLLDGALRLLRERPFAVAAFARPEVAELFPALWTERDVQHMRLGPLTRKACERLIAEVLGAERAAALGERLVARADGNAFFLEELMRAVSAGEPAPALGGVGSGARAPSWPPAAAELDALPESVASTVQARLDALGPEARRVLRVASVFGQTFWRGGVEAMLALGRSGMVAGGEGSAGAAGSASALHAGGDWLDVLVARELVAPRPAARFPGEEEYVFRNALVRDVAYAMLTDDDRARAHRVAAAWLERRGERDPLLLAGHLERGGDAARAGALYLRAAELALGGDDFAAAVARAERAVACAARAHGAPRDEPARAPAAQRGLARLVQAEACRWRGELERAAACAEEALACAAPGSAAWYRAWGELAIALGRAGRYEALAPLVDRWLATEALPAARGEAIGAGGRMAALLAAIGQTARAAPLHARLDALAAAGAPLEPLAQARLAQARAQLAVQSGDAGGYLALVEEASAAFARAGDRRNACMQQMNVGNALVQLGQFARAEQVLDAAGAAAERMNLRTARAFAQHCRGLLHAHRGEFASARALEEQARALFEAQGDARMAGFCSAYLAQVLLMAGDVDGAERAAREGLASGGDAVPAARVALGTALVRVLLARGQGAAALARAREALAELATMDAVEEGELALRLAHAEALRAAGADEEARAALAETVARLRERAARIADPALRASLLANVPECARALELERAWA